MYPVFEPYHSDYLPVSPVHYLYYEQVGNPIGTPVVFLHGGPGGGITNQCRRFFDPLHYRVILFDQRGSGKSRPYACIEENTTSHLVDDIEKLRKHLGIKEWIVFGGSWGSTLALAYAIAHQKRVMALVLRGIFLARQQEIDWLYGPNGAARLFPTEYNRFLSVLSTMEKRKPLQAYYQKLTKGPEEVQLRAAREWDIWESSISQLLPSPMPDDEYTDLETSLAIARIESHYFVNDSFLPNEDYLLNGASQLSNIPTFIVNGRYDIVCPPSTAIELHETMLHSELKIVHNAGHSTSEKGIAKALVGIMNRLKKI
jgi:proline iminopeptidase